MAVRLLVSNAACAMDLPKVLADLRAAGVTRARYSENGAGESSIEVEFGAQLRPAGIVGADGKAIDLDAGMNALHKDPLGLEDDDERPAPDPMLTKNFKPAGSDAAS